MRDEPEFVNPYWHRLATARPKIGEQVQVDRQEVRGKLWFVLRNSLTGQQFRITPEAWYVVGLLDGKRTVEDVMAAATEHLGDDAPGQGEVVRLLTQMHSIGVLAASGADVETGALYDQAQRLQRRRIIQQMRSPLAVRFPIFDPERTLTSMLPLARLIFSGAGFVVWLFVVGWGATVAVTNLDSLSANFVDRVLSAENIVLMTAVFVILKLAHEFGHGMAVRRWGGEVHEMGIMLLVLIPVPYVDASSASQFQTRLRRVAVSAAGMYVEMFLAALAIVLWERIEPGVLRAALYNAALIGSVSTLLFNLNPLLRFDGYYILSDLISMPNLGSRGTQYMKYIVQRYVLWLDDAATPETDPAEKRWLFFYSIAALCYRVFIVGIIAIFVAQKLFFLGVALALWAVTQLFVIPVLSAIRFLLFSPRLRGGRFRTVMRSLVAVGTTAFLLFVVPAPRSTYATGVVWVAPDAEIVVERDGFIRRIAVSEGSWVTPGKVLVETSNDFLVAELARLKERERALEARVRADFASDRAALLVSRKELEQIDLRIASVEEKLKDLSIHATTAGRFSVALAEDLEGRFVRRGERLGFIVDLERTLIRLAVTQNKIGLVREDTQRIQVRPVESSKAEQTGRIVREIPAASAQLPSMVLSTFGGGQIEMTTDENGQPRALQDVFHFELAVERPSEIGQVGQKVHVKFVHAKEPLGNQALLWIRQLFLSQLNV